MKLSSYLILFTGICICSFTILFYNVDKSNKVNRLNLQYAYNLSSACEDAMKTVKGATLEEGCVWGTKERRKNALNVFNQTLEYNFSSTYGTRKAELEVYTPMVCLIDNNGYYIQYHAKLDKDAHVPDEYDKLSAMNALNTWSRSYEIPIVTGEVIEAICSFHLDDTVKIVCSDGNVFEGERYDVHAQLERTYGSGTLGNVKFLIDDDPDSMDFFNRTKNEIIVSETEQKLQYYINAINLLADRGQVKYSLTMPEIAGEDWCRLLESPTIIAFLQGPGTNVFDKNLSIYALAGAEYKSGYHYFIVEDKAGNKIYHCAETEPKFETISHTDTLEIIRGNESQTINYEYEKHMYDGEPIEKFYPSMELCALEGAEPCQCVH